MISFIQSLFFGNWGRLSRTATRHDTCAIYSFRSSADKQSQMNPGTKPRAEKMHWNIAFWHPNKLVLKLWRVRDWQPHTETPDRLFLNPFDKNWWKNYSEIFCLFSFLIIWNQFPRNRFCVVIWMHLDRDPGADPERKGSLAQIVLNQYRRSLTKNSLHDIMPRT